MRLGQLLKGIRIIREFQGREEISPDTAMFSVVSSHDVKSISADSRKCSRGSLFIAVRGAAADGGKYIRDAIERGAQYIVCENKLLITFWEKSGREWEKVGKNS